MSIQRESNFKQRIIAEMVVDYSTSLEKNFDLAKQFVRITKDGKVEIQNKDRFTGEVQIQLYLIGKLYAKAAGFIASDDVSNKELMDELGIIKGSLLPWLKNLRDTNKIKQIKRQKYTYHSVPVNMVERVLRGIDKKMKKGIEGV